MRALRHPNFRLYWAGAVVSFVGTWLHGTALSWLVRSLTASPFHLGLVAFCSAAPMFVFSLFGGVLADRTDKRRVLMYTQTTLGIFAGILALLAFTETVRLVHIMVIAFLSGTAASLDAPLRHSLVYHLVDKQDLPEAIALNSVGFNAARMVGPAIAGMIIAMWGQAVCFGLNAVSFAAVVVALMLVKVDTRPRNDSYASVWEDLVGGAAYIRSHRTIFTLILMIAVPSLLTLQYSTLLPIIAKDILQKGAREFGWMLSAGGAGALIGALILGPSVSRVGRGRLMLMAAALLGVSLLALAQSRTLEISLLCMMGVGYGTVSYVSSTNALLQTQSSDNMRGRVMGAYIFTFLGLSPLGSLWIGGIAEVWSTPAAIRLAGVAVLCMAVWVWVRRPDIRML